MTLAVDSVGKAEITAETFQGISIQQEVDVACVLGLDLRKVTREILVQETLKLTDAIGELIEKGKSGDPESFRQAADLAEQKKVIADILHGCSVAKAEFATRTADNQFSFYLPGPTSDQTLEDCIRERLKDFPKEAGALITNLRLAGIDVTKAGPVLNEGVLRMNSTNKSLQELRELYKDVGGLADPSQAVNLCIEAVMQAREKEINLGTIDKESWNEKCDRIYSQAIEAGLNEGTATLLMVLTRGGIRAEKAGYSPVVLDVNYDGHLSARNSASPNAFAQSWALGHGAPAAE